MINRLRLIRNIGQFDSVNAAANIDLKRLTLMYAENGRGKTTLAAILRSLGTGEPVPINERRRLGAANPPEVIIDCTGSPQPARFQNAVWTRTCPDLAIFDDVFVSQNVYSGLDVDAEHRQNLHELILGAQGVILAHRVDELAVLIRDHSTEIRTKSNAIPPAHRHGFSVDDFCALVNQNDIDETIKFTEQRLAALQQAEAVRTMAEFSSLALPALDTEAIAVLLARTIGDLDRAAAEMVKKHFKALGSGAEGWIATGMKVGSKDAPLTVDSNCPFCQQGLRPSAVFGHYRAYFGEAYGKLQTDLAAAQTQLEGTFKGDALAGFERQVNSAEDRRRFWAQLCTVPEVGIDTTATATAWQQARDALLAAFKNKRADPLTPVALDAATEAKIQVYTAQSALVAQISQRILAANENIQRVKESVQSGNLAAAETELKRLRATKSRHSATIILLCDAYLAEKAAKEAAEIQKETAQNALNTHRTAVFPAYQNTINVYLGRLNAAFTIQQVQPQNTPGRPSCTYHLVVNTHQVPVAANNAVAGAHSFKNTLSAGDRNTLALAFFLASLEQDPNRANKIVVLDDPVSSLDEHRCLATIQESRTLAQRFAQVIVLSHTKSFLARIWQHADQANTIALQLNRDGNGSTIEVWDVTAESVTDFDRNHRRLRDYLLAAPADLRPVAVCIRPLLEGYLRVACSEHFPPGTLVGRFQNSAQARAAAGAPIIDAAKLTELGNLIEYGNKFHHDTNPAWDTEVINDGELRGFVLRAVHFASV